jgi:AAA domain
MRKLSDAAKAQIDTFARVIVKHPRLEHVEAQVTQAMLEKAGYSHLLVFGPTGVGKSTMIRRMVDAFMATATRDEVPVVSVEAIPSDVGAFHRISYYRRILHELKDYYPVKDILAGLPPEPKTGRTRATGEWSVLREAAETALKVMKVRTVIIDEAQHLMNIGKDDSLPDQLDWVKSMSNHSTALHVLVGNYDLVHFRNLNAQTARRGHDVHFPRYQYQQPEDLRNFAGALNHLLRHMPIACDHQVLLEEWRYFYERTIGCVGILHDWFVETLHAAMYAAEAPKATTPATLTLDLFRAHAPNDAQVDILVQAALAGEKALEVSANKMDELRSLLGMDAPISSSDSMPNEASTAPEAKEKPVRRRKTSSKAKNTPDPTFK